MNSLAHTYKFPKQAKVGIRLLRLRKKYIEEIESLKEKQIVHFIETPFQIETMYKNKETLPQTAYVGYVSFVGQYMKTQALNAYGTFFNIKELKEKEIKLEGPEIASIPYYVWGQGKLLIPVIRKEHVEMIFAPRKRLLLTSGNKIDVEKFDIYKQNVLNTWDNNIN